MDAGVFTTSAIIRIISSPSILPCLGGGEDLENRQLYLDFDRGWDSSNGVEGSMVVRWSHVIERLVTFNHVEYSGETNLIIVVD